MRHNILYIIHVLKHKLLLLYYINNYCVKLYWRALKHDNSKLVNPERECFSKRFHTLKDMPYDSIEYENMKGNINELVLHYFQNKHHPEHYILGTKGMDLTDIIEMYFDWLAASRNNKDGNMSDSLKANRIRFNLSDELFCIFMNTYSK